MYNLKLRRNQIVPIYTNVKEDENFEGMGLLIKKLDLGDSFYEDGEKLKASEVHGRSSLKKRHSKKQRLNDETFQKLEEYSKLTNPSVIQFWNTIKSLCTRQRISYNKMFLQIELFRDQFYGTTNIVNSILRCASTQDIIRFVQQTYLNDWSPTLFRLERWLVDIQPKDRFSNVFRTNRWIKILVAISPRENNTNSLSKYTTVNGRLKGEKLLYYKHDDQIDQFELEPTRDDIMELNEFIKIIL